MRLLDKILKALKTAKKKYLSDDEIAESNKVFMLKYEQTKDVFASSLTFYNLEFCQCAYPRFQQIVGIDCSDTGNSFKSHDTDLLISLSKAYFDTEKSEHTDEITNEKWVCKKCGSTYEYGWSDFSIYVERQKLKLTNLMADSKGRPTVTPIPLYLGLAGHSYPDKSIISGVDFDTFKNYMTEQ